ncbi:MAG: hypothetical protein IPP14_11835 [Planctomycetes bacterium]|nr:hypothetical protein [Planctomycetota bacterium]
MLRMLMIVAALLAPVGLRADLLTRYFPGKSEADIAKEFEDKLPEFLAARAKDVSKPRLHIEQNKRKLYLEIIEVKGAESTWAELVPHGWYKDRAEYGFSPGEGEVKLKQADFPPQEVALWFEHNYRTPEEMVSLVTWLALKGEVLAANGRLAPMAAKSTLLKPDIDAWLIAKHGWATTATLIQVDVHDFEMQKDGMLLLTKEAAAERLKLLDKVAKEALKDLVEQQGGDTKGKPGARKRSPSIRLDTLENRLTRYPKAFAGTTTAEAKNTKKSLDEMLEAVKADRKWVEDGGFKADRLAIDGDLQASADAWLALYRADPENIEVIQKCAEVLFKAAEVTDNGNKCVRKDRALKAAEMWDKFAQIQPLYLNCINYAGLNYMAAGEKAKAKARFEEVLRRTDKKELTDAEKGHREYAQTRMKDMK